MVAVTAGPTLLHARGAGTGVPTDHLRGSIDLILTIVTDPELKEEARTAERRKRIRAVVNPIFDWQARTPAEREPFIYPDRVAKLKAKADERRGGREDVRVPPGAAVPVSTRQSP